MEEVNSLISIVKEKRDADDKYRKEIAKFHSFVEKIINKRMKFKEMKIPSTGIRVSPDGNEMVECYIIIDKDETPTKEELRGFYQPSPDALNLNDLNFIKEELGVEDIYIVSDKIFYFQISPSIGEGVE